MKPAVATLAIALVAAPAATAGIPPEACVRLLREARIARMSGSDARELELLRQAEREYPAEALPLIALIDRAARPGAGAEERERLMRTLRDRLRSDAAVPASLIAFASEDPSLSAEELSAARSAVSARLATAPADPALLDASATLAERTGDYAAALGFLGKLGEVRPGAEVDGRRLDAAASLGRWSDVLEIGRRIAATEPSPEASLVIGRALVELGRTDEARQEIAPLLAVPARPSAVVQGVLLPLAWRLWDDGKDAEAREAFRMAADADPRNLQAKQALHALFASPEGRRSSSEAALSRTVVGAASSLQFSRGADLLAAGDAAGAIEPLQAAVKADPGFEPAWYNLGVAAWKLGRWEEARNAFSKASSLKRDRAESVFMLGAALVRLGRCPEAVKELERALAMKPDLRDARGFLAECYLKLGRAADAEEQLRRAKTGR